MASTVLHLLPEFKELKALSLQGYHITHLPASIKNLRLLRYLNLSGTTIISLPESVSLLFNLQILILRGCNRLRKLPSNMRCLVKLHHLDILGAKLIRQMPLGMKQLKYLRTLTNFVGGKGIGSTLQDLKNLTLLRGEFCISRL